MELRWKFVRYAFYHHNIYPWEYGNDAKQVALIAGRKSLHGVSVFDFNGNCILRIPTVYRSIHWATMLALQDLRFRKVGGMARCD